MDDNNENDIVSTLESVPIHLKVKANRSDFDPEEPANLGLLCLLLRHCSNIWVAHGSGDLGQETDPTRYQYLGRKYCIFFRSCLVIMCDNTQLFKHILNNVNHFFCFHSTVNEKND